MPEKNYSSNTAPSLDSPSQDYTRDNSLGMEGKFTSLHRYDLWHR